MLNDCPVQTGVVHLMNSRGQKSSTSGDKGAWRRAAAHTQVFACVEIKTFGMQ